MKILHNQYKSTALVVGCYLLLLGYSPLIHAEDENPIPSSTPSPAGIVEIPKQESISIISEIVFEGNNINKSGTLSKKIKSRKNQVVDRKKLQADIKILFETGDFEDVSVDIVSLEKMDSKKRPLSRIIFKVIERPMIKRIDYKGNQKIRATAFEDKVQSKENEPFDRYKASLDERSILEHYRNEGYANAKVEHYTTLDPKKKQILLTFFIIEGDRVTVKSVTIKGAQRFSEKTLQKKMSTRKKKVYKEEVLREDEMKILNFYKNNGYLDVEVSSSSITIDEEKNLANIELIVIEGPEYKVGAIKFNGSNIFEEKELQKALVVKPGKLFQQNKLDESVANINTLYADKGYLRTEIDAAPYRNSQSGTVDFDINIVESSIVYVDGVYVDGNTYTKDHVIKREVLLKPGDVFAAGRMRRSVERIYNLGFLEDVNVDVQQPRDPNLADLIFSVKEGKPGVLSAGAGFSSVDRFVGTLSIQHTNLFGLAQRLNMSYEFGARRQNFDIGWTDPWFLGHNMSGGIDLFNTVRVRDYPGVRSSFREKRRGVGLRVGPRITDDVGLLFAYTLETTEIFDVDASIKEDLFPTFGIPKENALETDSVTQLKSSLISEIVSDTRDNKFDATRGWRNAVSVETSGGPFGGEINYYKPQFTSSAFFPTFWKFVFSVSGRVAWVNSFSPSIDVPSSERFFLGGPDTLRGYDNNSITPRVLVDNEYGSQEYSQIPGRILTLFNFEYKFPIVQERNKTIFQGAFFLDVGGTWLETGDIDFTTGRLDNRMKAGAGFGFRFKTPVFPIRLDFGIPLNPRNTDSSRQGDSRGLQPYFTIGNVF
ncbi:MAG: Outer membrane protein assembly factor BamA [Elusimicrobia bacterium]|nr:Outer membrane protein assembly factor BamA [Elusimicrobiota bacterium]